MANMKVNTHLAPTLRPRDTPKISASISGTQKMENQLIPVPKTRSKATQTMLSSSNQTTLGGAEDVIATIRAF